MSTTETNPTAQATQPDELTRRRDAIAISGWGAPFRFVQPHNACFWMYLVLVVAGLWTLVPMFAATAGVYAEANAAAIGTSAVFAAVFLFFLHRADRWEHTPGRLALAAFVIGGIGSTYAIALPGNTALMSLYAKTFGQAWAQDWKAGLTAPFVEETAKGAAFLLLLGLAPVVIRTVYDGLIVGAYTGLGFQVFEDALYGQNSAAEHFGTDQAQSVLATFAMRAITGIASHALYTALFAAGLIYLIGTVAQPRRSGRGLLLMLAAMLLHGVWDSAGALAGGTVLVFVVMIVTTVAAVVLLFVALRLGGGRERMFLRDVLAPELTNGTITEPELHAVTGHRRDRRAALRRGTRGRTSRHREKHVLHAIRDLAEDLSRSGGEDSPDVEHSRSEIARLQRQA
ncbi:MAG: protease PrsW [Pseudonocardiales bacterium]|jgi:RsiW-degrading membrane proteinase PrsW (M82 family)|nr:protease PrsW [Pseudonocardiales bacterium]